MKLWRYISFTLFLVGSFAIAASAQSNSLKQISFEIDRYITSGTGTIRTSAKFLGDGIDVEAQIWQQTAPSICWPSCLQNSTVAFWGPDDNTGLINASGTIDGVFYPNLYIFHTFQYTHPQSKIPKQWTKTVRISAPITLTGNIGIWRTPQEVGNNAIALYLHNGINFNGRGKVILRSVVDSNTRFYRDKYISFDFTAGH